MFRIYLQMHMKYLGNRTFIPLDMEFTCVLCMPSTHSLKVILNTAFSAPVFSDGSLSRDIRCGVT